MRGLGTKVRWWLEGNAGPGLEALIADPDAALRRASSVAREQAGRKRFYRVATGAREPDLFVKVFTLPTAFGRVRYFLRPSKARREARIARRIVERGFDAATPVATGECRFAGLLARSYSVVPELPARDLQAILGEVGLEASRRRALLDAFARFSRRLHDAGIDQDDFSPNNFLWSGDSHFTLIDFERCFLVDGPLGRRRWILLAKLHRKELGVSRSERLRFLRSYLGPEAGRAERRDAWQRIRAAFLRIRRRDARRAARAAFKVGRHIKREGRTWAVRGREDAKGIRLDLDRRTARRAWVRAHQLERLGLPALRAIRLDPGGVELADPGTTAPPVDGEARVAATLRRFETHGSFLDAPEWLYTPRPVLRNPQAFRLYTRRAFYRNR